MGARLGRRDCPQTRRVRSPLGAVTMVPPGGWSLVDNKRNTQRVNQIQTIQTATFGRFSFFLSVFDPGAPHTTKLYSSGGVPLEYNLSTQSQLVIRSVSHPALPALLTCDLPLPILHCDPIPGDGLDFDFETLVMPPPHVLGPKYERRQRPRNSQGFLIGKSRGNLGNDIRRGQQSPP